MKTFFKTNLVEGDWSLSWTRYGGVPRSRVGFRLYSKSLWIRDSISILHYGTGAFSNSYLTSCSWNYEEE